MSTISRNVVLAIRPWCDSLRSSHLPPPTTCLMVSRNWYQPRSFPAGSIARDPCSSHTSEIILELSWGRHWNTFTPDRGGGSLTCPWLCSLREALLASVSMSPCCAVGDRRGYIFFSVPHGVNEASSGT